jgi:hypothetical protein
MDFINEVDKIVDQLFQREKKLEKELKIEFDEKKIEVYRVNFNDQRTYECLKVYTDEKGKKTWLHS